MEVNLVVQHGPARVQRIRLKGPETIIGRSRDCDLCVPSAEVSRRHCLLTLAEDRLTVEDLTSANGTYLNGKRISGILPVKPGDQLQIGPLTFTVEFQAAVDTERPAARSPKPASKPQLEVPAKPSTKPERTRRKAEPEAEPSTAYGFIDVEPVAPEPGGKTVPPRDKEPAAKVPEAEEPLQIDLNEEELNNLPRGSDFLDFLHKMDE